MGFGIGWLKNWDKIKRKIGFYIGIVSAVLAKLLQLIRNPRSCKFGFFGEVQLSSPFLEFI
jgi:hypothetical protein